MEGTRGERKRDPGPPSTASPRTPGTEKGKRVVLSSAQVRKRRGGVQKGRGPPRYTPGSLIGGQRKGGDQKRKEGGGGGGTVPQSSGEGFSKKAIRKIERRTVHFYAPKTVPLLAGKRKGKRKRERRSTS